MTTFGPPTTRKLSGAGSHMSDWEVMIDRALRHGDDKLASDLRDRRARVNLATGYLEPVFVPWEPAEQLTEVRSDPFRAIACGTVATREPSQVSQSRPSGRVSTIARGGR
jgi:hypothetical protein